VSHLSISKVGVLLDHGVSLRFVLLLVFQTCWATVQAKNTVRSTPASSALTLVSYRSHNAHTKNCHLCDSGEGNGAQSRTKVSFGRTMMQALELLRLAKIHISRQTDVEWLVSQSISQLVGQSVGWSVSQSVKHRKQGTYRYGEVKRV